LNVNKNERSETNAVVQEGNKQKCKKKAEKRNTEPGTKKAKRGRQPSIALMKTNINTQNNNGEWNRVLTHASRDRYLKHV
jgi:hypothetical protein